MEGKQHTILYPQDKKRNYQFPPYDGVLTTESKANEIVEERLNEYIPTKATIETALTFVTNYIKLSSTFVSTDNTFKDISDFQFNVFAGKTYDIELLAVIRSTLGTMGSRLGVRLSSGTGTIIGYIAGSVTNIAIASELKGSIYAIDNNASTTGASMITTSVAPINQNHNLEARLSFTCLTDGRFVFAFGNETTGTATVSLMQNSQLKVIEY